jgi:hypothetical protein
MEPITSIAGITTILRGIVDLLKSNTSESLSEAIKLVHELQTGLLVWNISLLEEVQALKSKEKWEDKAKNYKLFQANDSIVYLCEDDPMHFACPTCFGLEKLQILQQVDQDGSKHKCYSCGRTYFINWRPEAPKMKLPSYGFQKRE